MDTHAGNTPSDSREPEHGEARRRRQDLVGRTTLLVGGLLVYWILLAAPRSDQDKAKAVVVALALVACGALLVSATARDRD